MKTHLRILFYVLSLGVVSSSEASQRWLSRGVDHHLWENGVSSRALKTTFRYCHTKHPLTHRGIHSHPTEDAIFKYLMHDAEVRNSFLQSMLGETIASLDILDTSLNPVKSYKALRQLVTDKHIVKLMAYIKDGKKNQNHNETT